ncbi:MAG: hypothetical protein NVSMB32_09740 [Actinomycetota bacterium]
MSIDPELGAARGAQADPHGAMLNEGSPVDLSEANRPPTDDIIAKAEVARAAFGRAGGLDSEELAPPSVGGDYQPPTPD